LHVQEGNSPKRRFWKAEQKIKCRFSTLFNGMLSKRRFWKGLTNLSECAFEALFND
jgi:hypothetical protein